MASSGYVQVHMQKLTIRGATFWHAFSYYWLLNNIQYSFPSNYNMQYAALYGLYK